MQFTVIGIDDNQEQDFKPELKMLINDNQVFSGGKRHYKIVKDYLPSNHIWIEIKVPLSEVFQQYKSYHSVVVFASGDPLFNGFGNTILRELPDAKVQVFPYFNSLQLLAHKMLLPYQDMHTVSLTGRPWHKFDEALIKGYNLIGVLTDRKKHTPQTIAERMLYYGFDNYMITVGELLGNSEKERFNTLKLSEVAGRDFAFPNNIILQKTQSLERPMGISEKDFHWLNGRAKMITKMPIRLLSLSMLDLRERSVFWDIGFCTGSVSVEAKMQFPHLNICAFEIREEGRALIDANARKFHTPGIDAFIGNFTEQDLETIPAPDAVFIGGHGGKMDEVMRLVAQYLSDNGAVVFNSVLEKTLNMFREAVAKYHFEIEQKVQMQIDDFNRITVMKAIRKKH